MRLIILLTSLSLAFFLCPWQAIPNEASQAPREIALRGLPENAWQRIHDLPPTAVVESVVEERWEGPVYRIDFVDRGRAQQLKITAEGTVMQNEFAAQPTEFQRIPQPADSPDTTELPSPVQETIRERAGDAPVQEIRAGRIDTAHVYVVSFLEEGARISLLLDEEGRVLTERVRPQETAVAAIPLEEYERISILDAPAPVRSRIQQHAGPGQIVELYQTVVEGQEIYHAIFIYNNRQTDMKIAQDGGLLEVAHRSLNGDLAPVAEARPQPHQEISPAPEAPAAEPRHEIPPQVRQSIRELAPPGEVAIVTPEVRNGSVFYRVEILDNGEREIWLDREGALFAVAPGEPIREPAAAAPANAYRVHLPPAVRQTVEGLRVQEVHSAHWTTGPDGAIIYRLQIRHNGRQGEIQVREDGFLLP